MRLREKLFWLSVGVALFVLFLSLIPSHYEICEISEKTKEEHCARYQVAQFLGIKIPQFLDRMGGVLTALATLAIATFTLTLKHATDKLWLSAKEQMEADQRRHDLVNRAYIFGTPEILPGKSNATETVVGLSLQNYGIAAGIVEKFHMEFSLQEPSGPIATYVPGNNKFTSGMLPPTHGKPENTSVGIRTPHVAMPFFVFGYVEYLDLNRDRHTSRFCAQVFPGEDGIEIAGSKAWNEWD